MKLKLLTTLTAIVIFPSVFAAPPHEPKCPNAHEIKKNPIDHARMGTNGWIGNAPSSTFNTPHTWGFAMSGIDHTEAYTEQTAVEKYNKSLSSSSFGYMYGPILADDYVTWACYYTSNGNGKLLLSMAYTLPPGDNSELKLLPTLSFK